MSLKDRYESVCSTLVGQTRLLCVSKTKPGSMIKDLYRLGHRDFAENKVQELVQKSEELKELSEIRWHFIGSLQTNKLNALLGVQNLVAIHSIDRDSLLEKILKKELARPLDLFIQVNTSGEKEKGGFETYEDVLLAARRINESKSFLLKGLMTIGRIRTDDFEKQARESFRLLRDLKMQLEKSMQTRVELSMGMSSDYSIAMEVGSDWVRVGSSIFGARDKLKK